MPDVTAPIRILHVGRGLGYIILNLKSKKSGRISVGPKIAATPSVHLTKKFREVELVRV